MTLDQYTQLGLEAFGFDTGNAGKKEPDGVMGPKTQAAIAAMFVKLTSIFVAKGYFLDRDYNLLAIRMNDIYTNQFTDWGVITHGNSLSMFPVSTKPGAQYILNKTYVDGVKGCAVMVEGQYKNLWTLGAMAWTGLPYLQQCNPVNIYRDIDLDDEIDRATVYTGMFGINFHSWKGFFTNFVQNLSAGCQVFQADVHADIWPYIQQIAKRGSVNYTLLHYRDFEV